MSGKMTKAKVEVTINGSGFDNPAGGMIKKTREISSATLVYPNKFGRFYEYFQPRDTVRIYIGRDQIPDEPTFTGFVTSSKGENSIQLDLFGRMFALNSDEIIIDNKTVHIDGFEISRAISKLVGLCDVSWTEVFEGTDPVFHVDPSFRITSGDKLYNAVKKLRNVPFDASDFEVMPLTYILYEDDTKLRFRKEPPLDADHSWWTYEGGDNLLMTDPVTKVYTMINKQTVIGKDGVKGSYVSQQRLNIDGTFAGKPVTDNTCLTMAACQFKARSIVEQSKFKIVNTRIRAVEQIIDMIPRLSVLTINGARNVKDGLYRVNDVVINWRTGLKMSAGIESGFPLFGEEVAKSILSTGPAVTSPPSTATS